MAQPNQNANALTFAQELINFTVAYQSLLAQAQLIAAQQSVHNYAANLQALPTYAVTADGTPGAADGTPNTGNPIAGLNVSFYNLDEARTNLVNDFISLATGTAAPAQLNRTTTANALLP